MQAAAAVTLACIVKVQDWCMLRSDALCIQNNQMSGPESDIKLYSFLSVADLRNHHSAIMRYNCMQSWAESCNPGAWQSEHGLLLSPWHFHFTCVHGCCVEQHSHCVTSSWQNWCGMHAAKACHAESVFNKVLKHLELRLCMI